MTTACGTPGYVAPVRPHIRTTNSFLFVLSFVCVVRVAVFAVLQFLANPYFVIRLFAMCNRRC